MQKNKHPLSDQVHNIQSSFQRKLGSRWDLVLRLLLCVSCLAIPSTIFAQVTTGIIEGSVTDVHKAVVPRAQVTATNAETGLTREASTNESGEYRVLMLPPGGYTITVEKEGFRKAISSNIKVTVAESVRLDISLEVGAVAESVQVENQTPLIQTDNAEVGQVIERRLVQDLPLNGRQFLQLALLTPGVVENVGGTPGKQIAGTQGPQLNINGNRQDANNYTIDGATALDFLYNTLSVSPSIDSIQEFKVQSSLSSIQWGGQGGGYVNIITKSGTENFHGSAFEFLRNDKLDAHNYFDDKSKPVPHYRQNQFGATIGGPVWGKKTFFFGSYEGLRIRQAITGRFSVPTLAMRRGDFSAFANNPTLAALVPIDPQTGQPFPNNQIPLQRFNNASKLLMGLLPMPTDADPNLLSGNLIGTPIRTVNSDQFSIRVDHRLATSDNLFGRYIYLRHNGLEPFPQGQFVAAGANLPGFGQFVSNYAHNLALGYTKVFSQNTIMEARLGYIRTSGGQLHEHQGEDWGTLAGILGLTTNSVEFGPPSITISGLNPFGAPAGDVGRFDQTFEGRVNVTRIYNNHTFEFGGTLARLDFNPTSNAHRGTFTFNGFLTKNPFADFLLGVPFTAVNAFGDVSVTHFRAIEYSGYIGDKWQIKPRLTLTLGLRYDFRSPWRELDGRQVTLSLNPREIVLPGRTGNFIGQPWINGGGLRDISALIPVVGHKDAGYPRELVDPDRNNFTPRFGFAWLPFANQKTVIRGGYGIFTTFKPGWLTLVSATSVPFNTTKVGLNFLPQLRLPIETSLTRAGNVFFLLPWERNFRDGYVQNFTFGIQQNILRDLLLEIRYDGNKGTNLYTANFFNMPRVNGNAQTRLLPFLSPGSVFIGNGGSSIYHGMTLRAEKRFSHGLSIAGSWTWSRSIDNDSLMASTLSTNLDQSPNKSLERGLSTFDATHRVVFNYVYELPFGPGRYWGGNTIGFIGKLLEGWQLSGISSFQTGLPFTVNLAQDRCGTGVANCRPNRIADGNLSSSERTPDRWFDTSAFQLQPPNTYGNAGRDILWGPGYMSFDISLSKNTKITESQALRFQTDFFNATNHPNFDFPVRFLDSPGFGKILSAKQPRLIQFSLKYIF